MLLTLGIPSLFYSITSSSSSFFFFFEKEGLIYLMNRVYCGDGGSPCFIYIYIYGRDLDTVLMCCSLDSLFKIMPCGFFLME